MWPESNCVGDAVHMELMMQLKPFYAARRSLLPLLRTREKIDIVKLNAEIKEIVAREQVLREEIDRIIEEIEGNE